MAQPAAGEHDELDVRDVAVEDPRGLDRELRALERRRGLGERHLRGGLGDALQRGGRGDVGERDEGQRGLQLGEEARAVLGAEMALGRRRWDGGEGMLTIGQWPGRGKPDCWFSRLNMDE
jgi:hypothetical protein